LKNENVAITPENDKDSKDGADVSISSLQSQSWLENSLGWDFNEVWQFVEPDSYPVLQYILPTAINKIEAKEIRVYVAGDELYIDIPFFEKIEYLNAQIYDISGRPVNIPFFKKMEYLSANISSLPTGTYIVRVGNQAAKFVKK
jgi:hypothetical protein